MTKLLQDLPAARKASEREQAKVKAENAKHPLVFQLLSAANYIDALGGDSKSYRAAISKAQGAQQ